MPDAKASEKQGEYYVYGTFMAMPMALYLYHRHHYYGHHHRFQRKPTM